MAGADTHPHYAPGTKRVELQPPSAGGPVQMGQQGSGGDFGTDGIFGAYGEFQDLKEVLQEQKAGQEPAGKTTGHPRHPSRHHRAVPMGTGAGTPQTQAQAFKNGQA